MMSGGTTGRQTLSNLRKQYKTKGMIHNTNISKIGLADLDVIITKDAKGCTLSVASEDLGLQYVIPFDKMLQDLRRA